MNDVKVNVYDPVRAAFFECNLAVAEEFVESAKTIEKMILRMEKEESKEGKKWRNAKVNMYDPARAAFFECDLAVAKEFVKSAKETEKEILKIEKKEGKK